VNAFFCWRKIRLRREAQAGGLGALFVGPGKLSALLFWGRGGDMITKEDGRGDLMSDKYYEQHEIAILKNFLFAVDDYYELRQEASLALSLVPKETVDDVLKSCLYLARETDQLGFHVSAETLAGRDLIVIYRDLTKSNQDLYVLVVLHETAHYLLEEQQFESREAKEEAVNAQILNWLSEYEMAFPEAKGSFEGIKEWIEKAR